MRFASLTNCPGVWTTFQCIENHDLLD